MNLPSVNLEPSVSLPPASQRFLAFCKCINSSLVTVAQMLLRAKSRGSLKAVFPWEMDANSILLPVPVLEASFRKKVLSEGCSVPSVLAKLTIRESKSFSSSVGYLTTVLPGSLFSKWI